MSTSLSEKLDLMMDLYNTIKKEIRSQNPHLYERWKAGGFIVDDDIMSMYPSISKVLDSLQEDEEE